MTVAQFYAFFHTIMIVFENLQKSTLSFTSRQIMQIPDFYTHEVTIIMIKEI